MKRFYRLLACCLTIAPPFGVQAHETATHQELTRAAVSRSVLQTDPRALRDLGVAGATEKFPNESFEERTIEQLLQDGSRLEDSIFPTVRPSRHFYNPLTGKGMDEGRFLNQATSPEWALAPRGSISSQQFSYWDARQYLLDALTKPSDVDRKRAFGLTFQTLGQVIHHLQDMAQPQHVRNDAHCSVPVICWAVGLEHAPSFFERWTDDIRQTIVQRYANPTLPTLVGYDITGSAFTSAFNSPRRFWHTELAGENSPVNGKGIAEFTNRNFVSAGTNFDKPSPPNFALPAFVPTNKTEPTVAELCADTSLNPPCPPSMTARAGARLTFYATVGRDNFLNTPVTNPRASTESIFDEQLRVQGVQPVFALNRFNFDEAYKHLIPRAVAFSAGMINYFFRGKLDAVPQGPGTLLVKNLSAEEMMGDFGLYYDDAEGTRRPVTITTCRVGSVDVPVAQGKCSGATLASVSTSPNTRLEVSFTPPTAPAVPAPKTAGEYVLVFNGSLGEERADPSNGVPGAVVAKAIGGGVFIITTRVESSTTTRIRTYNWKMQPLDNILVTHQPNVTLVPFVSQDGQQGLVAGVTHTGSGTLYDVAQSRVDNAGKIGTPVLINAVDLLDGNSFGSSLAGPFTAGLTNTWRAEGIVSDEFSGNVGFSSTVVGIPSSDPARVADISAAASRVLPIEIGVTSTARASDNALASGLLFTGFDPRLNAFMTAEIASRKLQNNVWTNLPVIPMPGVMIEVGVNPFYISVAGSGLISDDGNFVVHYTEQLNNPQFNNPENGFLNYSGHAVTITTLGGTASLVLGPNGNVVNRQFLAPFVSLISTNLTGSVVAMHVLGFGSGDAPGVPPSLWVVEGASAQSIHDYTTIDTQVTFVEVTDDASTVVTMEKDQSTSQSHIKFFRRTAGAWSHVATLTRPLIEGFQMRMNRRTGNVFVYDAFQTFPPKAPVVYSVVQDGAGTYSIATETLSALVGPGGFAIDIASYLF